MWPTYEMLGAGSQNSSRISGMKAVPWRRSETLILSFQPFDSEKKTAPDACFPSSPSGRPQTDFRSVNPIGSDRDEDSPWLYR